MKFAFPFRVSRHSLFNLWRPFCGFFIWFQWLSLFHPPHLRESPYLLGALVESADEDRKVAGTEGKCHEVAKRQRSLCCCEYVSIGNGHGILLEDDRSSTRPEFWGYSCGPKNLTFHLEIRKLT